MPKTASPAKSPVTEGTSGLRLGFADFLAKLSARDRANAEKRMTVLEGSPDRGFANRWRRLAGALFNLAPHAPKLAGRQAIQFYVADGKYRMQVFTLEDLEDGIISVYCPDVMAAVLKARLLKPPADPETGDHAIVGSSEFLKIMLLDRGTIDPPIYYKDMIGWNRKALQIALPASASTKQLEVAEAICAIAAKQFAQPAAAAASS
jgi:hypothetical protein